MGLDERDGDGESTGDSTGTIDSFLKVHDAKFSGLTYFDIVFV